MPYASPKEPDGTDSFYIIKGILQVCVRYTAIDSYKRIVVPPNRLPVNIAGNIANWPAIGKPIPPERTAFHLFTQTVGGLVPFNGGGDVGGRPPGLNPRVIRSLP